MTIEPKLMRAGLLAAYRHAADDGILTHQERDLLAHIAALEAAREADRLEAMQTIADVRAELMRSNAMLEALLEVGTVTQTELDAAKCPAGVAAAIERLADLTGEPV